MKDFFSGAGAVICLIAIVAVGAGVAVIRGRRRRSPAPPRWSAAPRDPDLLDHPPDESWLRRPRPGEIWRAEVPYEDGIGGQERACLVVRTLRNSVDVLKITGQDKSGHPQYIPIANAGWVDLAAYFRIGDEAFGERVGECDEPTWWKVRKYHETGWIP